MTSEVGRRVEKQVHQSGVHQKNSFDSRSSEGSLHSPVDSAPLGAASNEALPGGTSPGQGSDRLTELLIKHRWATVVPLVLPMSKAYDAYWRARHIYYRNWANTKELHGKRVQSVVDQIKQWDARGRKGLLCTSRKGWQTVSTRVSEYKQRNYGVDVDLHDILEIDTVRRRVRIEPRVNMGQLSQALVKKGWTIPVVPELDDLTAGGLLMGYGIESSSHKYGLFYDTVLSAEVVLSDGRVVECDRENHAELFHSLPWSYGAHGFLTALELPIIPCKPHVRLTYERVASLDEACERFEDLVCAAEPPEFVEGLMYSLHEGVLIYGDFADVPKGERVNSMGRWHKPWFYKHAEAVAKKGRHVEYVPLRDWYHRHTRSLYFHGELLVPFGNHPAFRYPLGWLMPPKVSIMKLIQTEKIREFRDARNVVQDVLVPIKHMKGCIEMFHREFECYPLWLCPHKTIRTKPEGMLQPSPDAGEEEMYVDVGAWQVPAFVRRGQAWDGHQAVRNMEAWLRAHHGFQCMYAVTEQTREEFWEMFDPSLYHKVRKDYGGEGAFMDVYDKVKRPGMR